MTCREPAKAIDPCPVCGRPADPRTTPFCSSRCADIDLGRWLGERYVIPGPEEEPGEEHDDGKL